MNVGGVDILLFNKGLFVRSFFFFLFLFFCIQKVFMNIKLWNNVCCWFYNKCIIAKSIELILLMLFPLEPNTSHYHWFLWEISTLDIAEFASNSNVLEQRCCVIYTNTYFALCFQVTCLRWKNGESSEQYDAIFRRCWTKKKAKHFNFTLISL